MNQSSSLFPDFGLTAQQRHAAVRSHYYEKPGMDGARGEIWAYSDRFSYRPGETVRLQVSATAQHFSIEIVRDGGIAPRRAVVVVCDRCARLTSILNAWFSRENHAVSFVWANSVNHTDCSHEPARSTHHATDRSRSRSHLSARARSRVRSRATEDAEETRAEVDDRDERGEDMFTVARATAHAVTDHHQHHHEHHGRRRASAMTTTSAVRFDRVKVHAHRGDRRGARVATRASATGRRESEASSDELSFWGKIRTAYRIFFPPSAEETARQEAKKRLRMILVADRCTMSESSMDEMKMKILSMPTRNHTVRKSMPRRPRVSALEECQLLTYDAVDLNF